MEDFVKNLKLFLLLLSVLAINVSVDAAEPKVSWWPEYCVKETGTKHDRNASSPSPEFQSKCGGEIHVLNLPVSILNPEETKYMCIYCGASNLFGGDLSILSSQEPS